VTPFEALTDAERVAEAMADEDRQLREAVEARRKLGGISLTRLGVMLGYATSTVGNFLTGAKPMTPTSRAKFRNFIADTRRWQLLRGPQLRRRT
jgi:hypothetical protein